MSGFADSWRSSTSERRFSVPVAVRCIGRPAGTMTFFAPWASNLLPLGRLHTGFASQRVPRLRAGVDMSWNGHAWSEYRLQEYHRVLFVCIDRERPDFRDGLAARSLPAFFGYGEQPNPSERLRPPFPGGSWPLRLRRGWNRRLNARRLRTLLIHLSGARTKPNSLLRWSDRLPVGRVHLERRPRLRRRRI